MKANVGNIDRIIRLVLGIVLVALPFVSGWGVFAAGWATALSVVVGVVLIATALMRFCLLYTLLGMNTCPR